MTEFEILTQLKRVELKFQEHIETRNMHMFFAPDKLRAKEASEKKKKDHDKTTLNA